MPGWVNRLWRLVQEPRKQTTVYFFVYLMTSTLGVALLVDPPRSLQGTIGGVLVLVWAGMLAVGGLTGLTTVIQGWWWLERAGTVLCGFAMLVCGVAIWALPISQFSLRLVNMCLVMLAFLLFVARLVKTRHYSYDPEK